MTPSRDHLSTAPYSSTRRLGALSVGLWCLLCMILLPANRTFGAVRGGLEISPELTIASGVSPADSDTTSPGKPAIGSDGVNHLVVSCRDTGSAPGIFGVLVSSERVAFKTFPIANINPIYGCGGRSPSVAFDGANYLVTFNQVTPTGSASIVGTRVSPSGTVLDGPDGFGVLSSVSGAPAVAFDGTNYLVVTVKYNNATLHDIYGARVSPAGQVLNEFPIFIAPGGQVFPSVAFDGANYLVIWSDTRSGSPVGPDADIFGARVTPAGIVLDPGGIPISTARGIQEWPHVIFDGTNFFAVWEDTRNDPGVFPPRLDIYGTRIRPDGVLLDGPSDTGGIAINTASVPKQHPVAGFNGTDYYVSWEASFYYDPPVGIFAARVSAAGHLIDADPILISEPSCSACRLVWPNIIGFDADAFVLIWAKNAEVSGTTKDIVGVVVGPPRPQAVGVFRPTNATFYLDHNGNGVWDGCGIDRCLQWGTSGEIPLLGDWNGTGLMKLGSYRHATGSFYLDYNGNGQWDGCGIDRCIAWGGDPSDVPIVGDWSGDQRMKVGVYRKATGIWYLDYNGNGVWDGCGIDACFAWGGDPSDVPGVADWTGDGTMKVGVYRKATGYWYGDPWGTGVWYGCDLEICVHFGGEATDVPVLGDWTGDGAIKLGIYRAATGMWYLDMNQNGEWDGCAIDKCVQIGLNGDIPIVGDWNGSGSGKVGVFRPSDGTFYLDYNGNGVWDGCGTDKCLSIGMAGDVPLVGKW
jgi:hypothetical protein